MICDTKAEHQKVNQVRNAEIPTLSTKTRKVLGAA